ncbi:MAG: methionine--tRNA ligase [Acidobacteria bacterium]|nr:MAG: methionine--tRNA ligase [Acidobacteriota bacterium]
MSKFYLTTPIYYPNARPHVGSAYTTIVCDVIARYKRMCGYDVAFLTGTDEHGEKLRRAAEEGGKSPAEFVAEKRKLFTSLWQSLGIPQYSQENPAGYRFVHTSQNPEHVKSVHWMLRRASEAGCIEKKKYEGRYCIFDERYVSDGTDPVNCDICGRPAELISEENYFFKLHDFEKRLLDLYERQPGFVQPDYRMNEVKSFVKGGLRDISISRKRLKWGIPWPDDPEQVVYVWYDALTSYLTGIGFRGLDEIGPDSDFQKYWMADDAAVVHMIGKDIIRFHAIYWPAFLMAAGLPLPKTIFAHGWIYYEQDKMSKSKGNVVYPEPIVDALDSFGAPGNDALRYYLLRDTPFGQDASFSYDGLVQRYNSDLANGLGNLASRTLAMVLKYCDGTVPDFSDFKKKGGPGWDEGLRWDNFARDVSKHYDTFNLSSALEKIGEVISHYGDQFLTFHQPWKKADNPENRYLIDGVLYIALEAVRAATVLAHPVIPDATQKIWNQLGCEGYLGKLENQRIDQLKWGELKPCSKVSKPEPIFPRLDKAEAVARLQEFAEADRKGHQAAPVKEKTVETPSGEKPAITEQAPAEAAVAPAATPASEKISIEDFAKVEMRVGEIISAEPIPKADKLLKLQVDIGTEVRQVCAGIAEHYQPEQLVGMKVILVTNLQPRKLRGVESNGMIVAASVGERGRPVLATFKEDVPKGAKLR